MTDQPPDAGDDEQLVPLYSVGVGGPSAALLLDLKSIEFDLRHAAVAFAMVVETDGGEDGVTRRALSDSASIAYRRGFTTGRSLLAKSPRARVPDHIVESLSETERQVHDEILAQANQHIAHRVAPHEQGVALVLLNNPINGQAVIGVQGFIARWNSPMDEAARASAAVADKVADGIALAIKEAEEAVMADADAKGLDFLYGIAKPMDGSN